MGWATAPASQTFLWTINASPLAALGDALTAVAGTDTGSVTLATFTTADLASVGAEYTAMVSWGDGCTEDAAITGGNGSFTVSDDHTYIAAGTYTMSVAVSDEFGDTTTVTATATASDAAMGVTGGFDSGAVAGQSATFPLANLTDANPALSASDFTVSVSWGDGSSAGTGALTTLANGSYAISGAHNYATVGTYTVGVTVTDPDGQQVSTTSTVTVGNVFAGVATNLTVASFTNSDPTLPASSYTASINWGDGVTSAGQVLGSGGTFTVQGTHSYADDSLDQSQGSYTVTVTVTNSASGTINTTSSIMVVRPPLSLVVGNVLVGDHGVVSNAQLGVFTEPDVADTAAEFTAVVNWGDGTSSSAVVSGGSGMFQVLGSHDYATGGTYPIVVDVYQGWQQQKKVAEGAGQGQGANASPIHVKFVSFTKGTIIASDATGSNWGNQQWKGGATPGGQPCKLPPMPI